MRKSADAFVTVKVIAPCVAQPKKNDYARHFATIGDRQLEGARPDVIARLVASENEAYQQQNVDVGLLNDRAMLQTGTSLLHRFCRMSEAGFTSVGRHGVVQNVLDVPPSMFGSPIDFVMANRTAPHTHARSTKSAWYVLAQGFTSPIAYCCMDVYLHW